MEEAMKPRGVGTTSCADDSRGAPRGIGGGGDDGDGDGVSTATVVQTSKETNKDEKKDKAENEVEEDEVEFGGDFDVSDNRAHMASRLLAVLAPPQVALTFLLFLVMGASMAVTDTFLFLWLDELGGAVQVQFSCDPQLESAWVQPLHL
jgi:hypothetical protein